MGNQPPPKQQQYNPRMEKTKLEIACMKVKGHLELQRDRRTAQANAKEQQLIVMMNSATRSMVEEKHKAAAVVSDISFIEACNIVIRNCDILKDRSMHVCESKGNPAAVKELLPIIETIIWSTRHLNLSCLQEFTNMMIMFYGSSQVPNSICDETKVDPALKKCFENVMPTDLEINNYFIKLSQKTGITLSQMNAVGHDIHECNFPPNQPFGGNGGQQQPPIFVPNIQTQYPVNGQFPNQSQQQGNYNINIRIQDMQGQQYPPQNNQNFGGQQYQYPQQQQQNNQQQFNNQQPQFPSQQAQFNPQQQQQQQQQQQLPPQNQYPTFNYPPQDNNANNQSQQQPPKYNFPQVQLPQFNVQNQNQNQNQNFGNPVQPNNPPQANIPQNFGVNNNAGNNMPTTDSLEERLKRIREGI